MHALKFLFNPLYFVVYALYILRQMLKSLLIGLKNATRFSERLCHMRCTGLNIYLQLLKLFSKFLSFNRTVCVNCLTEISNHWSDKRFHLVKLFLAFFPFSNHFVSAQARFCQTRRQMVYCDYARDKIQGRWGRKLNGWEWGGNLRQSEEEMMNKCVKWAQWIRCKTWINQVR